MSVDVARLVDRVYTGTMQQYVGTNKNVTHDECSAAPQNKAQLSKPRSCRAHLNAGHLLALVNVEDFRVTSDLLMGRFF